MAKVAIMFFIVVLMIARPVHAEDWSSVEACISDMGAGDGDSFVQTPPSAFSKSKSERVSDWCRTHRSQAEYRLSEIYKAGLGLLFIITAFIPLILFSLIRARYNRKINVQENYFVRSDRYATPYHVADGRLAKAQTWSFVGAVMLLNGITITSCVLS